MARRATRADTPWLFSRSCSAFRSSVSRRSAFDQQLPFLEPDRFHAGIDRQHFDLHDEEQVAHFFRRGTEAVGELVRQLIDRVERGQPGQAPVELEPQRRLGHVALRDARGQVEVELDGGRQRVFRKTVTNDE